MPQNLSAEETRIIGCLIEKSVVTPDQYPLSLNALTNACNQKTSRNPVMSLSKGEVQRSCRLLEGRSLLRIDENFRSSVEKYSQRLCNTRYSDYQFDPGQLALVCVLMLRGPQTPGELRSNCRRLHEFADNDAVVATLRMLAAHEHGPVVQELGRKPGRRDAEYAELLSGPVDVEAAPRQAPAAASPAPSSTKASRPPPDVDVAELAERVAGLEAELAALRKRLGDTG